MIDNVSCHELIERYKMELWKRDCAEHIEMAIF